MRSSNPLQRQRGFTLIEVMTASLILSALIVSSAIAFSAVKYVGAAYLVYVGIRKLLGKDAWKKFPKVDHVHFYGMYIGNYPDLEHDRIRELCKLLNEVRA